MVSPQILRMIPILPAPYCASEPEAKVEFLQWKDNEFVQIDKYKDKWE